MRTPSSPGPFERKLRRRADFGVKAWLLHLLLEPANPFDPKVRRSLRRAVGALGGWALGAIALVLAFHFAG